MLEKMGEIEMSIKETLLNLLFPHRCPFCWKIGDEEGICPSCQGTLPWIVEGTAPAKGEFFQGCYAPLWYSGWVRPSIHRYKFGGRQLYAPLYATLMAQSLEGQLAHRPHCILWSPLSRRRLCRRGYDQSFLLARELSAQLDIPLVAGLEKWRNTKPQSSLKDESARRANSMGAYRMAEGISVEGKRILLVDDVVTSGSTLSECARILLTAGALEVNCVTLARARK